MAEPDFLVVGAAKAGTSSLHVYLGEHPEIFVAPRKEPNFFALPGPPRFRGPGDDEGINRTSVADPAAYLSLFAGATTERAVGEVSPLYLYEPSAAGRIKDRLPAIRLVAVLRNPVERAFAAFLHKRRDGFEPHADFAAALAEEPARIAAGWEFLWHYTAAGRYAEQVGRYLDLFPAHQLRVYLYEDLTEDPAGLMKDLFGFLGVDDAFLPDVSQRYNPSGVPRSRAVQRVLTTARLPRRVARAVLPDRARDRLYRSLIRTNLARPPLAPDLRRRLVEEFQDDVIALQRLIDRDLSAWLR